MVLSLRTRKDELSIAFLEDTLYLAPPTPSFGSSSTPPSTPASTSNAPSRSPSEEHLPEGDLNAPQSEPSNDPILRGQVTLINHAPRKAKKIRVQLVGRSAAHGGDGSTSYEATNTLEKTLEIDLKGERLEKGTHTYVCSALSCSIEHSSYSLWAPMSVSTRRITSFLPAVIRLGPQFDRLADLELL